MWLRWKQGDDRRHWAHINESNHLEATGIMGTSLLVFNCASRQNGLVLSVRYLANCVPGEIRIVSTWSLI